MDHFHLARKRRSADFEALKLRKGRSGEKGSQEARLWSETTPPSPAANQFRRRYLLPFLNEGGGEEEEKKKNPSKI